MTIDNDSTTQSMKIKNKHMFFRLNNNGNNDSDNSDINLYDVSNELIKSFVSSRNINNSYNATKLQDELKLKMSLPNIVIVNKMRKNGCRLN